MSEPRTKIDRSYGAQVVLFLLILALGLALTFDVLAGYRDIREYAVSFLDATFAAAAMMVLVVVYPRLYAPHKLVLSHVFIFPLLFVALVFLAKTAALSTEWRVMLFYDIARSDLIWANRETLIILYFLQVIGLAVGYWKWGKSGSDQAS